jgi:hypothetical protein
MGPNALASRAPISPYIPRIQSGLFPLFPDLGAGDTFIISIVPLLNVFSYLHSRIGSYFRFGEFAMRPPWVFLLAADLKELECALSTASRGDVSAFPCETSCFIEIHEEDRTNMWAKFRGTINRSSPINALPVALILFSPFAVRGSSVVPV